MSSEPDEETVPSLGSSDTDTTGNNLMNGHSAGGLFLRSFDVVTLFTTERLSFLQLNFARMSRKKQFV